MKRIGFIFFCIALAAFSSCDIIEPPYLEGNEPDPNPTDTNTVKKKVLLEEYTGHTCIYCPAATDKAKQLKDLYGDQLIVLAIHAGFQAEPQSSGNYTYDFTTQTGDDLNTYFGIPFLPQGLVSRLNKQPLGKDAWAAKIDSLLQQDAEADIRISTSYNESNRSATVTVDMEFLSAASSDMYLSVYLMEDSIIKPQLFPNGVQDLNYVHNHVLRESLNNTWGTQVKASAITAGETFQEQFNFTLNANYVAEHVHVVAFIHDNNSKLVIQADEHHLVP